VLTGGGATLPMIQGLGNGIVKFDSYSISRQMATLVPDWVIDNYPYFEDEYPQLAVALGGACSALPEPGPSFAKFYGLGGKTNQWHVEKFQ
jgi:molecular chaperone HscA